MFYRSNQNKSSTKTRILDYAKTLQTPYQTQGQSVPPPPPPVQEQNTSCGTIKELPVKEQANIITQIRMGVNPYLSAPQKQSGEVANNSVKLEKNSAILSQSVLKNKMMDR